MGYDLAENSGGIYAGVFFDIYQLKLQKIVILKGEAVTVEIDKQKLESWNRNAET